MEITGLIPDGYTDCTGLINRAIQQLPDEGGELVLPPGDILIEKPIIIDRSKVSIRGYGREITRLLIGSSGLGFSIGHSQNQISRIRLSDLTINTTNTLSNGAGISAHLVIDIRITNCLLANLHCGIELNNASFAYITDVEIIDPGTASDKGIGVLIHGNGIHNDQYLTRVFVQSRKQVKPCDAGYRIVNTQGIWMDSCGAFHCNTGVHLMADNGKTLEHVFLSNNAIDSCVGHGFLINAGPGARARRIQSIGDWSSSNQGHGVLVDGAEGEIEDIKLLSSRLYGNGGDGVHISNTKSITIDNATIAGNGINGHSSGISIANPCELIAIRNNIIGAYSGFENTQSFAISGLDHVSRGLVTGNIFEPNRNGVFSAVSPRVLIANNLDPVN